MKARETMKEIFKELRKDNCLCRVNFSCCMSCACSELEPMRAERGLRGVVYWHRQDEERYRKTGILEVRYFTAYGGGATVLGTYIVSLLVEHDAVYDWDGDPAHTITVYDTEEIKANDLRGSERDSG
jgi:hypothetical protein